MPTPTYESPFPSLGLSESNSTIETIDLAEESDAAAEESRAEDADAPDAAAERSARAEESGAQGGAAGEPRAGGVGPDARGATS